MSDATYSGKPVSKPDARAGSGARKPVLLTVSGTIPPDISAQIQRGARPRADYLDMAEGLDAETLDYAGGRAAAGRLGGWLERLGGPNVMLAYACWRLRKSYQAILTDGEQVGLPLALMLKLSRGVRPAHLMIVHILSVPKKMLLLDWLGAHSCIDRFLVYSTWQKQFIQQRWKLPPAHVVWTPFMVDAEFFSPDRVKPKPTQRPQICAVGLERRDYPTLLQAVEGLDIDVVVAAASPWSKYKDSTSGQQIPDNVQIKKFSQYDLRQLYADSACLVMPLEPAEFQAGVTAILEAMAMAKPVICSRAPGQTDVIIDGENGRYVPCGDPLALRAAILKMLAEPDAAARLGAHGRQRIERDMSLQHYVVRLDDIVREAVAVGQDTRNGARVPNSPAS
jgi:glycosyltransferase involved in cell wall biosynthesis